MKIGILTFFRLANYGANLQALSTYCYLKNQGFEAVFIDWEPNDFYFTKVEAVINNPRCKHHFDFVDEYLPRTRRCITDDDICKVIEEDKIEAIIIGSDAVLQNHPFLERLSFPSRRFISLGKPNMTTTFPSPFWGSFLSKMESGIPVAVMSGSSQDSKYFFIVGDERRRMAQNIRRFAYISVRDTWTQKMINYLTKGEVNPDVTPDPVFALKENAKDKIPSKKEVSDKYGLPEKYVLLSFWDNSIVTFEWLKVIGDIFINDGITPVAFPMPGGVNFNHPFDVVIDKPTPLEWYSIIANASAYVGEKMHPIVSSLSNAVPCFNFDHCGVKFLKRRLRYAKSSKIYHIMNEFGVKNNRVNGSGIFYKPPKPEFVYNQIKAFDIEACKQKSDEYLTRYQNMMSTLLEKIKNV